jgi:uncharacterized protein
MQEKVYVSESAIGRGVFAKIPLKPRETIFYLNGKLIDFEKSIDYMGEYSVQIGARSYVDPISPARYLNHSCEPNAGFVDEISLIALRPILPGEEIRFDYSTTMLERHWELDCSCGASACRRRIRDFDLIPYELQHFYLELGVVQSFILEEVAALRTVAA